MVIKSVNDPSFKKYGKVIKGIDFSASIEVLKTLPCPDADVIYEPVSDDTEFSAILKVFQELLEDTDFA